MVWKLQNELQNAYRTGSFELLSIVFIFFSLIIGIFGKLLKLVLSWSFPVPAGPPVAAPPAMQMKVKALRTFTKEVTYRTVGLGWLASRRD